MENASPLAGSAVFGAVLFGFFVLPWQRGVSAPAVFGPSLAQGLYAPAAAYVSGAVAPARDDQPVAAGAVLAVLRSAEPEYRLKRE